MECLQNAYRGSTVEKGWLPLPYSNNSGYKPLSPDSDRGIVPDLLEYIYKLVSIVEYFWNFPFVFLLRYHVE